MPNAFTVHRTRAIDIDVVFYDNFDADHPENNIVNTTVIPEVECPSGKCDVGFRTDTRKVFVDGIIVTDETQPVNVFVRAFGREDVFTVSVLEFIAGANPAVVVGTGHTAEYDPASRP